MSFTSLFYKRYGNRSVPESGLLDGCKRHFLHSLLGTQRWTRGSAPEQRHPAMSWRSQLWRAQAGRQMCALGAPLCLGFLSPVTVSTQTFVKQHCPRPAPSLSLHYWDLSLYICFFFLIFHLEHCTAFFATELEILGCRQDVFLTSLMESWDGKGFPLAYTFSLITLN